MGASYHGAAVVGGSWVGGAAVVGGSWVGGAAVVGGSWVGGAVVVGSSWVGGAAVVGGTGLVVQTLDTCCYMEIRDKVPDVMSANHKSKDVCFV